MYSSDASLGEGSYSPHSYKKNFPKVVLEVVQREKSFQSGPTTNPKKLQRKESEESVVIIEKKLEIGNVEFIIEKTIVSERKEKEEEEEEEDEEEKTLSNE